jgi:hypothetical protein
MAIMTPSDCAILVISTDKYQDIWDPFFKCFEKSWKDCPFPVYLGSNTVSYKGSYPVKTILSGPDKDWSSSARSILSQIPEKYLFIILDDFMIISSPDNDVMSKHFQFMKDNDINHMHFMGEIIPFDSEWNKDYGILAKRAPYRQNVFGFWNKDTMRAIMIDGENPWNFEIMGSYRSQYWDNFLVVREHPFKTLNTIEKGSYIASAVEYCKKNGIELSFERRQVLAGSKNFRSVVQGKIFYFINRIPWKYRLGLMNVLRKLLSSY